MPDFSQYNSIWSVLAMIVFYGITEIIKWKKKAKISRKKDLTGEFLVNQKRLELLHFIDHSPKSTKTIARLITEYDELCEKYNIVNGYIEDRVTDWRKNKNAVTIEDRLLKMEKKCISNHAKIKEND
jgi:hypothetical protein